VFFDTVDFNNDGHIQFEEFVEFWEIVKGTGHTEEEIMEEVSFKTRESLFE
jgi:Ca2+-binding EF-hand superfamily protein